MSWSRVGPVLAGLSLRPSLRKKKALPVSPEVGACVHSCKGARQQLRVQPVVSGCRAHTGKGLASAFVLGGTPGHQLTAVAVG